MQSCVIYDARVLSHYLLVGFVVDHHFSIEKLCCKPVMAGHSFCITEGVDRFVSIDLFQYVCVDSFVRLPTNHV